MEKGVPENPKARAPKPPFPEQQQEIPAHESRMSPEPDFGEKTYQGLGRLKDKVALVTGGDSGIGRAVALAYAREGADVAIAYLDEHDDAKKTKALVEAAGRRALLLPGDLADEEHCHGIVDETVRRLGRLDVLVNNAAFQGKTLEKFEDLDPARLERTFKVNILAMFHLIRWALPHLKPGASIINTASIQAYQPSAFIIDYASTKGAIITLTKGLAPDLAKRGIRVNGVAPGPVWTPLIAQSFPPEKVAEFGKAAPFERPAQPVELAPAYVFLASSESSYVSGEILAVTGGKPTM